MKAIYDVVVVGGGVAGLVAATELARSERSVALLDDASSLGGRARSQSREGFTLNQGAHALYAAGAFRQALARLGVPWSGKMPTTGNVTAALGGKARPFPTSAFSLLTSSLFGWRAKKEVATFLRRLPHGDPSKLAATTAAAWLDAQVLDPTARRLVEAYVRVSTFGGDFGQMSAECAASQAQLGSLGVYYLDGGWQTLVDGLEQAARQAGVTLRGGARVLQVEGEAPCFRLPTREGDVVTANAVVLAVSPSVAASLAEGDGGGPLRQFATSAQPVRAACLDVALERVPRPQNGVLLGLDGPTYVSNHSLSARLGPRGGAVVHALKYIGSEATDSKGDRAEIEEALTLLQPGWRGLVRTERYLPKMTVHHALVTAAMGGFAGRPPVQVSARPGLFLAGDWVGRRGLLADAAAASATDAADAVKRFLAVTTGRRHAA